MSLMPTLPVQSLIPMATTKIFLFETIGQGLMYGFVSLRHVAAMYSICVCVREREMTEH